MNPLVEHAGWLFIIALLLLLWWSAVRRIED